MLSVGARGARLPLPPSVLPLAAVLGPWCTPGQPSCAFVVDDDRVWFESTNTTHPARFDGRTLTLDPGGSLELTLEVLTADEHWIQARPPGEEPRWFYRQASERPAELLDGREERWPEVATLARGAPWRFAAESSWRGGGDLHCLDGPHTVVERASGSIHLVGEWYGVRLGLWVRSAAFEERLARDTRIAPGVTALAGTQFVRTGPTDDGLVPIQVTDGAWTFDGIASEAALDLVWRHRDDVATTPRMVTREPMALFQAATGPAVLGRFDPAVAEWWLEAHPDEPSNGRCAVVVRTPDLRIEGWAESASLQGLGPAWVHGMGGGSWGTGHTASLRVEPGTPLYVGDTVVGVTLEDANLQVEWDAEPSGVPPRLPVWVSTPMESVELRVDCKALTTDSDDTRRCMP